MFHMYQEYDYKKIYNSMFKIEDRVITEVRTTHIQTSAL
jgi:hypothetical protein